MGRGELRVQQRCPDVAQVFDEPDQAYFRRIPAPELRTHEHRLTEKCSAEVDAIETADKLIVPPGLNAVGESQPVELDIRGHQSLVDPGSVRVAFMSVARLSRGGAGSHHRLEVAVKSHVEGRGPEYTRNTLWNMERLERKNRPRVRTEPVHLTGLRIRHWKRTLCVGHHENLRRRRLEQVIRNGRWWIGIGHGRRTRGRRRVVRMQYRRLGRSGLTLSTVGLGSWLTFNDGDQERANSIHRAAVESGINFFDTANAYGGGTTERVVSRALAPFRRDALVIATKLFWPVPDWPFPGANDRGLSRKHIFEQCAASLKRLNVDYIDLYQCHRFDEETPLFETCRAMNDLIRQGKILYWGVSEWNAPQIEEALTICEEEGLVAPISNQPLYNMIERHWEDDVFPLCRDRGLGIVNFSPLAEGLLTGKYDTTTPPDGSRAADEGLGKWLRPRLTEENLARVARLNELAQGIGVPLAQLALAWCHRRPELTSTIVGASRPEQIRENAAAADIVLDDPVRERVAAILGS